ncbi:MAG: hypothetical protein PHQ85_10775 [Eubacteriales bacterium]|jgi:alcohol dehydrogenase class IV|nr:hypothetical protein [Eubacteriales bacterium]MDD4105243.1 hypothetical protein [Eubacteriales bacterium]
MENELTLKQTHPETSAAAAPVEEETAAPAQEKGKEAAAALQLREREKALEKRERLFKLRETLQEKGLPRELADLIDVSDEDKIQEALQKAEKLVRNLRQGTGGAPPIGTPPENLDSMSYRERAERYLKSNAYSINGGM